MIDLDWQQTIFRAGRAWLRALRALRMPWVRAADSSRASPAETAAARLADHATALTVLARALSGRPVRLVGDDAGSVTPARSAEGPVMILPAAIDALPESAGNRELYLIRVAVLAAVLRLRELRSRLVGFQQGPDPDTERDDALRWLIAELPGFSARVDALRERVPEDRLFGDARAIISGSGRGEGSIEVEPTNGERTPEAFQSEVKAPRVGEVEWAELDERPQGDIMLNPFERVETLDSWRGGSRNQDGADDLEAHLEALSEVELDRVTRGGGPARSLLRADIALDVEAGDVVDDPGTPTGIPYDEWDQRMGDYRRGWCTVHLRRFDGMDRDWVVAAHASHHRRIERLAHRLERLRTGLLPEPRQLDGEDLDLTELVDEHATRRAGRAGDGRVYVRPARPRRELATTVLLDLSLSSDAWVGGRRVLDVSREAVFVLGEVTMRLGDRLRILGFASETRHRCLVWDLLGWEEAWSAGAARLGALSPRGYTRIGPALRHATAELARIDADRKLLLLVSDAKPTDSDRYEGRHGLADVRQAIREASRLGLHTHALAIDAVAREWLPALFGPGSWDVLPRPELVPEVLVSVYGRLTALPH